MTSAAEGGWRQDRIRLTLPNDLAHAAIARNTVRAAAAPYGYTERDLDNWETVIEEAVTNVVRYAYEPGEKASFDIDCLQGSEGLTVRIRDRGRPFDPHRIQPVVFGGDGRATPHRGLGWHLMQRLMDVVTLESLGREGKQLTLFKAAPHHIERAAHRPVPQTARRSITADQVVCRKSTAEDAGEIMRLFYDCYRYSYFNEQVYSAQSLARMIDKGEIESYVAELPDGAAVSHLALVHYADRPNGLEYGMAATDPNCRGLGLFQRLLEVVTTRAMDSGKTVRFGGAVTAHPASQKGLFRTGFNECGLMLGAVPAETFAGVDTRQSGRGTILFCTSLLKERPVPRLVLPAEHATFIGGIYEHCGMPFERGEPRPPKVEHSDITIAARPMLGTVRSTVQQIGADLGERIRQLMHVARQSRTEVGQLFLPLVDPALPEAVATLERMGWFVTGVLPEGSTAGDVLLMHWLNGWAIDYDSMVLARDQGQRMLQQVRARDPEGK